MSRTRSRHFVEAICRRSEFGGKRLLLLGVEVQQLGRGGIKAMAEATGVHPDTVARGVWELEGTAEPSARVRAVGLVKYTKKDVDALPINRHDFHGEWNYTVEPATRL